MSSTRALLGRSADQLQVSLTNAPARSGIYRWLHQICLPIEEGEKETCVGVQCVPSIARLGLATEG
jgi:hypothetical protein